MASRVEVKKLVVGAAELYGKTVSEFGLEMWINAIAGFEYALLAEAFQDYVTQGKFMPTPADIVARISPVITDEMKAVDAANRIIDAMAKFGHTNQDKAQEYMGTVAWEIVVREGGWLSLCARVTNDDLPILKAQWRELAKSVMTQARAGKLGEAPQLPDTVKKLLEVRK